MTGFEIFVQWSVFAAVLFYLWARRQLTIFHPTTVYLAFHALVFCIRPTLVNYLGFDLVWNYTGHFPTGEEMALALYLSSAGLVVFCIAFVMTSPHPGPAADAGPGAFTASQKKAFWTMAALLAPLGVYSVFAARPEGHHVGGVFVMTGTTGYVNDLQQVLIPITILLIVMCRWRWYSFLPFLIFLYYRAAQGWGRWTIVLTLFALVLFHTWENRKNLPALRFLLPLPLVFVLFSNLGLDRSYFRNLIEGEEPEESVTVLDTSESFASRFDTLDFANFDYLTYIVAVVPERTETYTYGSQYLQLFTEPIPRRFWKNKPAGPPVVFFDLNDYGNFLGLTPSLVGDGWMSGGWIGALLTMALAGWLLGLLYTWFFRNQHSFYCCFTFLIVHAVIVQFFRDGGISIAKFLLFCLLPIFVWKLLAKFLFPERQADVYLEAGDELHPGDQKAGQPWLAG
jgi:oligosaccharide repeat unit polymerase